MKKTITAILAALLLLSLFVACKADPGDNRPPLNDEITYLDAQWDEQEQEVKTTEKTISKYYVVKSDTTHWNNSWYVVTSDVTVTDRIVVS